MSLVLTGSQVMQVLDMDLALTSAGEAFRAYGEGRVNIPPKAYLTLAQGDFRAMYGEIFLDRDHICGLKWVNVHPGNPARGSLTVMAKIILNDRTPAWSSPIWTVPISPTTAPGRRAGSPLKPGPPRRHPVGADRRRGPGSHPVSGHPQGEADSRDRGL